MPELNSGVGNPTNPRAQKSHQFQSLAHQSLHWKTPPHRKHYRKPVSHSGLCCFSLKQRQSAPCVFPNKLIVWGLLFRVTEVFLGSQLPGHFSPPSCDTYTGSVTQIGSPGICTPPGVLRLTGTLSLISSAPSAHQLLCTPSTSRNFVKSPSRQPSPDMVFKAMADPLPLTLFQPLISHLELLPCSLLSPAHYCVCFLPSPPVSFLTFWWVLWPCPWPFPVDETSPYPMAPFSSSSSGFHKSHGTRHWVSPWG